MATKQAIGKMQQDALNRIAASMDVLADRFDIDCLDLDTVRDRDPFYQWAARLTALADWLDALVGKIVGAGIDMGGAQTVSANLDLILETLDRGLNALKLNDLKEMVEDLGLDFRGSVKQEYVNEIALHLTGQPLEVGARPGEDDEDQDIAETAMDLIDKLEAETWDDEVE